MNSTIISEEKLLELKELLKQADEALVNNVYAKNKIKEALNKLNQ
jgi:succinate dehydrogenase flavin-adding protein (antitoxin of CptAB toxin-antitoxin module)